jgi:hypothetical protein
MLFDDLAVGKRLFVGNGKPEILGRGPLEVRGSAYIEGPEIVGNPNQFKTPSPTELGTLMCGQTTNVEMKPIPFYSLFVRTFARIKSFLKVDTLLTVELINAKIVHTEVLMAKTKNFIIDHPTKNDKKLIHACLEGAENGVYVRGRLTNSDEIKLPYYWCKLVDPASITISLTPIGSHQDLCIKRLTSDSVIIQSRPGQIIDCFYHIFAERVDVEKLTTEIDS